jgi:hypothetical protein
MPRAYGFVLFCLLFGCSSSVELRAEKVKTKTCEEVGLQLKGEVSWKKRDRKTRKVKKFSRLVPVRSKWSANSDAYERVYIQGQKDLTSVDVETKSKLFDNEKKTFSISQNVEGFFIKNLILKNLVLGKPKPFEIFLSFKKKNKLICTYNISAVMAD